MLYSKIAGVRLNNSNGSGTFLAMALLSQLISSGDSFCTGPAMGADVVASLRGTMLEKARVATHARAAPTMMLQMPFPAQLPVFDPLGWILDGARGHAPILRSTSPVEKVNEGNEGRANSADLSSQLTLNYYFQHLKQSTGLRFDELSECSSKTNLLLFAKEHSLGGVDAALDSTSAMYDQICKALTKKQSKGSSGTGRFSVGSNTLSRIEPLEEYGKLKPMPVSCQENVLALTKEVFEAYGVKPEKNLHFEIASILDDMKVPYATDFTIHNGKLYMDLMMTSVAGGGKVLIMARDTTCFSDGTQETTSYIKMKSKSLRSMGYSVTAVPFFEWQKLPTKGQKVAYLAGKLTRNGYFGEGGGKSGESATRVKSIMRATR